MPSLPAEKPSTGFFVSSWSCLLSSSVLDALVVVVVVVVLDIVNVRCDARRCSMWSAQALTLGWKRTCNPVTLNRRGHVIGSWNYSTNYRQMVVAQTFVQSQ